MNHNNNNCRIATVCEHYSLPTGRSHNVVIPTHTAQKQHLVPPSVLSSSSSSCKNHMCSMQQEFFMSKNLCVQIDRNNSNEQNHQNQHNYRSTSLNSTPNNGSSNKSLVLVTSQFNSQHHQLAQNISGVSPLQFEFALVANNQQHNYHHSGGCDHASPTVSSTSPMEQEHNDENESAAKQLTVDGSNLSPTISQDETMVQPRPKLKQRRRKKTDFITASVLEKYFQYSQEEAATMLGISLATLKRKFYELNPSRRWPSKAQKHQYQRERVKEKMSLYGNLMQTTSMSEKLFDLSTKIYFEKLGVSLE